MPYFRRPSGAPVSAGTRIPRSLEAEPEEALYPVSAWKQEHRKDEDPDCKPLDLPVPRHPQFTPLFFQLRQDRHKV